MHDENLERYQREAKKKLRQQKQKMGKLGGRIEALEEKLETLETKWEGLTTATMGMCEVMDKLILKLSEMTGAKGEVGKEIAKSMEVDMEDFYRRKMEEVFDVVINIDVGDRVICDLCGTDWTTSEVSGGFMFAGKGVCPDCEPDIEKRALEEGEEGLISHRCPKEMSHGDWIRDVVRPANSKGSLNVKTVGDWINEAKKEDGDA